MIEVDISTAIFFYLFFSVILTFLIWIWLGRKPGFDVLQVSGRHIWQCSICSYVYINMKDENLSRCPRCKRINERHK